MKFFIDFEATQFTNEIISIGCVAENGESFYSEVNCEGKITEFITNLTGLTAEQISNAPSADKVFSEFEIWLSNFENEIHNFYVFGNSDETFIKATLKRVTTISANRVLCLILGNLVDYSKIVKRKFNLQKEIGLVKILEAYKKHPIEQTHNALQDAFFLQEVFNFVREDKTERGPIPDNYFVNNNNKNSQQQKPMIDSFNGSLFANNKKKKIRHNFSSIKEAVDWVMSQDSCSNQAIPNNIAKKIVKAINTKTKYLGFDWRRG